MRILNPMVGGAIGHTGSSAGNPFSHSPSLSCMTRCVCVCLVGWRAQRWLFSFSKSSGWNTKGKWGRRTIKQSALLSHNPSNWSFANLLSSLTHQPSLSLLTLFTLPGGACLFSYYKSRSSTIAASLVLGWIKLICHQLYPTFKTLEP